MAPATEHPSALFGTAARAFHLLENQGVDTRDFLQRLIDDTQFCADVVRLYVQEQDTLPTDIHPDSRKRLVLAMFGLDQRRYEALPDDQREYYDNLMETERLLELMLGLEPRAISFLMTRYDPVSGQERGYRVVASTLGVGIDACKGALHNALNYMRNRAYEDEVREAIASGTVNELSLDRLGLPERAYAVLMRAGGFYTIGDVLIKSTAELRQTKDLGRVQFDHVMSRLELFGLSLNDDE